MNNNRKLPDTPWHVGYAKKEIDDPKRHKSRCIFYDKGHKKCRNLRVGSYQMLCPGSAHCKGYAESEEAWNQTWRSTRSLEQEKQDNIIEAANKANKYQLEKIEDRKILAAENKNKFKGRSLSGLRFCLLCQEKLENGGNTKRCPYCGAVYSHQDIEGAFIL